MLGLCIGGGSNVDKDQLGYILFMINTEQAKQKKFKWYQKNVFVPGVNRNHLLFDEFDVSVCFEISVKDTAVVSCDSNVPQLKVMLEELDMYDENGITFNKLSAASSASEQVADWCPVFKAIKDELPMHTGRSIPPECCTIKRLVHKAFQSNKLFGLKLSH